MPKNLKFTAPEDRIIRSKLPDNAHVVNVVNNVVEILKLIEENPEITTKELGTNLAMSERQIQRVIKKLIGVNDMDVFFIIFLFMTGLVFGSFFNVVIYRVPENKSIVKPRSACGACGTTLKPADLIPVFSFLLLKGKCRYCKTPISWQYPLVELITGLLFVILFLKFKLSLELLFSIYFVSILLIVFFIDLKHMIIPNGLIILGLAGGFALFTVRFFYNDTILGNAAWYSPLLGMVTTSGFLFLVALLGMLVYKGDAMGMGDVKLYLPIGLFLGMKLGILSLVFSVFIGGITGLFLIMTGLKKRKSQIPFGPFIVAGTFLSLLFGNEILLWYLGRL